MDGRPKQGEDDDVKDQTRYFWEAGPEQGHDDRSRNQEKGRRSVGYVICIGEHTWYMG